MMNKGLAISLFVFLFAGAGVAQNTYTVNTLFPGKLDLGYAAKSVTQGRAVPFKLAGGLIMINAQINGSVSNCVFDTGAPSLVINKNQELIKSKQKVFGVTGDMKMGTCVVNEFKLGGLKKRHMNAIELDISHLEKVKKQKIQGIIGVGAYRQEHFMIDYSNRMISFLPRKFRKRSKYFKMVNYVPFICKEQLPIIQVKIGKRTYYFGVDTGAEVNVFNKKSLKRLMKNRKKSLKVSKSKTLAGVNSSSSKASTIIIDDLKVKRQTFEPMEFTIMDLGRFSNTMEVPLDGILGYPFLKDNLVSFDFQKSRLRFWELK